MADLESFDYRSPLFTNDDGSDEDVDNDIDQALSHPLSAKIKLDEPHQKRKLTILNWHPQITALYGSNSVTFFFALGLTCLQLIVAVGLATLGKQISTFWFLLITFFVGASSAKILGIIIHEASHNLIFKSALLNIATAFLANTTIPLPIAMSFRRYHLMHHAFQGIQGKDPDLPLPIEKSFFSRNRATKFIYLLIYPIFYLARGVSLKLFPNRWEIYNIIFSIFVNVLLLVFCGSRAIWYLFLSFWFGYTIHPAAAHFIQEHFVWKEGQETYSYYGPLNRLFLNIGYHVEHHDFMEISWTKLPMVTCMAPEFYITLFHHQSWVKLLWDFVHGPSLGPNKRYRRSVADHVRGREMIRSYLKHRSFNTSLSSN